MQRRDPLGMTVGLGQAGVDNEAVAVLRLEDAFSQRPRASRLKSHRIGKTSDSQKIRLGHSLLLVLDFHVLFCVYFMCTYVLL